MKTDILTEFLNKLVAICQTCGRGTYAELADYLGKSRQQVVSYVTLRNREPSGRVLLKMQEFAAEKTLLISKRKRGDTYRREFKIACLRFPLSGTSK